MYKKIFLFVIICSFNGFTQENSPQVELYFGSEQGSGDISFLLANKSKVWGSTLPSTQCFREFFLTSNYNSPSYTAPPNLPLHSWGGLDFTTSITDPGVYDVFGYGLYKITNSESDMFFYLDYRDQRFGCVVFGVTVYGNVGHPADLWLKYNATSNIFSYHNGASLPFYDIPNGEVLKIWELKNAGMTETSNFPNFWQNCMAADFEQGYTTVFWGKHPSFNNITKYNLYMAITHTSQIPAEGNFTMIKDFTSSTFYYQNFIVPTEYNYLHFFIRAEDSELGISERTNIVTIPQQLLWEESLQLFVENSNPKLVWGPHPSTTYNNGFNVYRAVVSLGQPEPAEGNFALLTPNGLSNSTFTYTDGDINLGSNNNSLVYYFVKAKGSGSTLSSKTNTVNIDGRYIEIEKKKENEENEINNFSLSQNHPNPFNPTTTIVYQIPTAGIVNLSINNLLGEKVAVLLNDYKEAGEYTVQFNTLAIQGGLPSGTYIYTLTTNRNRISKKLSVMK